MVETPFFLEQTAAQCSTPLLPPAETPTPRHRRQQLKTCPDTLAFSCRPCPRKTPPPLCARDLPRGGGRSRTFTSTNTQDQAYPHPAVRNTNVHDPLKDNVVDRLQSVSSQVTTAGAGSGTTICVLAALVRWPDSAPKVRRPAFPWICLLAAVRVCDTPERCSSGLFFAFYYLEFRVESRWVCLPGTAVFDASRRGKESAEEVFSRRNEGMYSKGEGGEEPA